MAENEHIETEHLAADVDLFNSKKKLIEKMDKTAMNLLGLCDNEKTSDSQKGRLFAQAMAWMLKRDSLIPSDEGDNLKRMGNELKSKGGERSGSTGRAGAGKGRASKDGSKISAIIRSLPAYGRPAGGNPAGTERQGGSADGDVRSVSAHGGSNGDGNMDGAGNSAVV
jgi:hypothetical protein